MGLDEYETRTWAGWHHHIVMCVLGRAFLLGLQQDLRERCRSLRARRGTEWCGSCYPGKGLDRTSCCTGWRMSSGATSGRNIRTRSVAPPAAGKHPSPLLKAKAAVVIPGRPRIMTDCRVTQKPLFPCDNPHQMSLRVNYAPKLFGKGLKPCRRVLVRGLDNR